MLEGLVAWVLNTYIGEYLENLNTDQLSVALLHGQVDLENVPLKKNALRKFDVPLTVKSGILGKLTLKVPLTGIRSSPWVVEISDVYVLLEPSKRKYDVEIDEHLQQNRKQQQLEALEMFHKQQICMAAGIRSETLGSFLVNSDQQSNSYQGGWFSFGGAGLVSMVVENIQLILSNVHVRFEDSHTLGDGRSFSAGLRVQRLCVQTTNHNWEPSFVNRRDSDNLFKVLEVEDFSFYWNSSDEADEVSDVSTVRELRNILGVDMHGNDTNSYILWPTNIKIRMEKNASKFPLKTRPTIPRFLFEVEPENVAVEMSKRQLDEIRQLLREWARFDRARTHRKWRPQLPVHNNCVLWWRFAANCHVERIRRRNERRSWPFVLRRVNQLVQYARAYRRTLTLVLHYAQQLDEYKIKLSRRSSDESAGNADDAGGNDYDGAVELVAPQLDEHELCQAQAIMKQIEHVSTWQYEDLHLLRDTVFRQLHAKCVQDNPVPAEQAAEMLPGPSSPVVSRRAGSTDPTNESPAHQNQGAGFYGWLSSWWQTAPPPPDTSPSEANELDGLRSALSPPSASDSWHSISSSQNLPDHLRTVEKNLEEEIMDVLHETWDDTNLLRRDSMLAKIIMRIKSTTWRFVNQQQPSECNAALFGQSVVAEAGSLTKVLAFELSDTSAELRLSPRYNATGLTLVVGDLNVHSEQLCMSETDASLLWGKGVVSMFALGKSPAPVSSGQQLGTSADPLLRCVYERRAPGLTAKHTLCADLAPVSVMYHERALATVAEFFDLNNNQQPNAADDVAADAHDDGDDQEIVQQAAARTAAQQSEQQQTRVSISLNMPHVDVELRNDITSEFTAASSATAADDTSGCDGGGKAFACAHFDGVKVCVLQEAQHEQTIDVELRSLWVEDLLATTAGLQEDAECRYLLRTSGEAPLNYRHRAYMSSSCPDLCGVGLEDSAEPDRLSTSPGVSTGTHMGSPVRTARTRAESISAVTFSSPQRSASFMLDTAAPAMGSIAESYDRVRVRRSSVCSARPSTSRIDDWHSAVDSSARATQQRRASATGTGRRLHPTAAGTGTCHIHIRNVDAAHPLFNSKYDKVSQTISTEFGELQLGMNRATFTLLLDFFGLIAPPQPVVETTVLTERVRRSIEFTARRLCVRMQQDSSTHPLLGLLTVTDTRASITLDQDGVCVAGSGSSIALDDRHPSHSQLYPQRLWAVADPTCPAKFELYKYSQPDAALSRAFDMRLRLQMAAVLTTYVHTQRYLTDLLNYWMHLVQLQDALVRTRALLHGTPMDELGGHGTRVSVELDLYPHKPAAESPQQQRVSPLCIALPLCSLSDRALVLDTSRLTVNTTFDWASQNSAGTEWNSETADVLLERIEAQLHSCALYRVRRVDDLAANRLAVCRSFAFARRSANVLDDRVHLALSTCRNLDAHLHKSVADLSVGFRLSLVRCALDRPLLSVIRGVLERNLGEDCGGPPPPPPILAVHSMLPAHQDDSSDVDSNWTTFSLRVELADVVLDCADVTAEAQQTSSSGTVAVRVDLQRASLSFDAFADGSTELDLIAHQLGLRDARYEDVAVNKRANCFPHLLTAANHGRATTARSGSTTSAGSSSATSQADQPRLMGEMHILTSAKQPPKQTIVLSECELLLIVDWWKKAAAVLSVSHEYPTTDIETAFHHQQTRGLVQRALSCGDRSDPTTGASSSAAGAELKFNLRDCNLLLIEDIAARNSAALVVRCTTVLHLRPDAAGDLQYSLDAQSVLVSSCLVGGGSDAASSCPLTNRFGASLEMSVDRRKQPETMHEDGLNSVAAVRHRLELDIRNLIGRLSYRDYLLCSAVVGGFVRGLGDSSAAVDSESSDAIVLSKLLVKSSSLTLWMLDDFQDTRFPLARVGVTNVDAEQLYDQDTWFGSATLAVHADFFNQQIYGWEPLVEPCQLDLVSWKHDVGQRQFSFDLQATSHVLNVNLSQTFLQQFIQFTDRWSAIKPALQTDYRSLCGRERNEHLAYILKNDTGATLQFTTETSGVHRTAAKWRTVGADQAESFEFPRSLFFTESTTGHLSSNQLIIRVEGWTDVSPVAVDSVGTYFRLVKQQSTPALLGEHAVTRVVVVVSMDAEGRKIVTVRSALLLVNALPDVLEVHLDNSQPTSTGPLNSVYSLQIQPGAFVPVPLQYASTSRIRARPIGGWSVHFCNSIQWQQAKHKGQTVALHRLCDATGGQRHSGYRMCVNIKREHYPGHSQRHQSAYPEVSMLSGSSSGQPYPGHTVTFVPPLTVLNLLPVDLTISLPAYNRQERVPLGQYICMTMIDVGVPTEFNIATESCNTRGPHNTGRVYVIPDSGQVTSEYSQQLVMFDWHQRPLHLLATVTPVKGAALKLTISASYWLVNKTGIPLVFKQESVGDIAAGQYDEHEQGRNKTPLMFSFADDNAPYQLTIRIGRKFAQGQLMVPRWTRKFPLHPGVVERKLVLETEDAYKTDHVYSIGVEVRLGVGLYKNTVAVIVTARHVLDNRSRYHLIVAQHASQDEACNQSTISPNCSFVWHWTAADAQQLLAVKRTDLPHWALPIRIDRPASFHLNIRDADGRPQFLRVEISQVGSIFYTTFSDADTFPPPIRIENESEVPIMYRQQACEASHHRHIVHRREKIDYAWDNPMEPQLMCLTVYRNRSQVYDLTQPWLSCPPLVYENYNFIAFGVTFDPMYCRGVASEGHELVFDVLQGGKVILNKMDPKRPTQLWRQTSEGMLENIGMSQSATGIAYVLDVFAESLDGHSEAPLMLQRVSSRRQATQTWHFDNTSRMHCGVRDMYVQSSAMHTVVAGQSVVLAPVGRVPTHHSQRVPVEQLIERRKEKPGSGQLDVSIEHEGPTRVVRIRDMASLVAPPPKRTISALAIGRTTGSNRDSHGRSRSTSQIEQPIEALKPVDLAVNITFQQGIGFSLVTALPAMEELIYGRFTGSYIRLSRVAGAYQAAIDVIEIQADNQLLTSENWHLMYARAVEEELVDEQTHTQLPTCIPALKLETHWVATSTYDAFETLTLQMRKLSVHVDEQLLWKLMLYLSCALAPTTTAASTSASSSSSQVPLPDADSPRPDRVHARRCYFGHLMLCFDQVFLTVITAPPNSLSPELQSVKQQWNVPLVRFENAEVHLDPFQQHYYFETYHFLWDAIQRHFAQKLRAQAMNILGSVDFLGNPIGLWEDIKGGMQELMFEGNVGGLVTGVSHGLSNSVVKVASSLSSTMGRISMDTAHERQRQQARMYAIGHRHTAPLSHFYSGLQGLGIGVLGGFTSVISGVRDGMQQGSSTAVLRGASRGVIGTFTKPIQGVLDLASGTGAAFQEAIGGKKSRFAAQRVRLPRVTRSLKGTLPPYSEQLAEAQSILSSVSKTDSTDEICLSLDVCYHTDAARLLLLICTDQCYVVRGRADEQRVLLSVAYRDLQGVVVVPNKDGHMCLEIRQRAHGDDDTAQTKIRCYNRQLAETLCHKILYAKQQHDDIKRSLVVPEETSVNFMT